MVARFAAQLHEPVPVAQFLQHRLAVWRGAIDPWEFILEQQIKDGLGIAPIRLLARAGALANLGGIADPDGVVEFKEQLLKPGTVAARLEAHNGWTRQASIESLNLLKLVVPKLEMMNFAIVGVRPDDDLLPCVKINATIDRHGDSFHHAGLFNRKSNNLRRRESPASSHHSFAVCTYAVCT